METIAYATVINANRPGLWPCHEHYSDKQVSLKARHSSHGEVPYEKKNNSCSKLHRQLRDDMLDLRGMHHFSHRVLRGVVSLALRTQAGRHETKEQIFRKFNMNKKPQCKLQAMVASYHRLY